MSEKTQPWTTKRFIGDTATMLVHDRRYGLCDDETLLEIVRRDAAVGFAPDDLASALAEGFEPCPDCALEADLRPLAPFEPPRPPASSCPPPVTWALVPVSPRGPRLRAGNAASMEDVVKEESTKLPN